MDPISLVQKAKDGDLRAFTQIVNHFQHRVYAFALGRLSSRVDAEEISLDPAVHDSLRKNFVQFDRYFSLPTNGEDDTVMYSHLKEDPQYDDIAVLCTRRRIIRGQ